MVDGVLHSGLGVIIVSIDSRWHCSLYTGFFLLLINLFVISSGNTEATHAAKFLSISR